MSSPIGQKLNHETPAGLCTVVVIRGGELLEIRRFGVTFTPHGYVSGGRVVCHPYSQRRTFASLEEWRAAVGAGAESAAPPSLATTETTPSPAPTADPETVFWARINGFNCTRLVAAPSAKDEAWERRDRAAYDVADSTPRWAFPSGQKGIWLAVQAESRMIPVCINNDNRVLRFLVEGELRTLAEAGVPVDAPLWRRVSEEDPSLVRVV